MRRPASKVTMGIGVAAASLLLLLLAAACGGATSVDAVVAPVDAGPDMTTADGASSCDLDAGTCKRSSSCCVKEGSLVDLAAKCRARGTTIFSCRPRGCVTNAEVGCFQRALPDGSVEIYTTSTTSDFEGFESQFTSCSRALYDAVTRITQPCP